jgi:hypothetical protein
VGRVVLILSQWTSWTIVVKIHMIGKRNLEVLIPFNMLTASLLGAKEWF